MNLICLRDQRRMCLYKVFAELLRNGLGQSANCINKFNKIGFIKVEFFQTGIGKLENFAGQGRTGPLSSISHYHTNAIFIKYSSAFASP